MTTVQNTVTDPVAGPYANGLVRITLITAVPGGAGYLPTGDIVGTATLTTDQAGHWSTNLTPNASITPANTVYQVVEGSAVSYITVPATGGPYWLSSILAVPPIAPNPLGITGVQVAAGGTIAGVRPELNLIAGAGVTVSAADNPSAARVDVTLAATGSGELLAANNLGDLVNASTARANLGLGAAATENVGTTAGTVAAGNDTRITGALQAANNLADVASAATARTNLGLSLPLAASSGGTGASPTAAGLTPQSTAAGAASWQGAQGPVYNVLAYGADPTGASDSTLALQGAINAAQTSAGVVYLPAGTYLVAGIPQITGSGITVRGAGWASVIKLGGASANAAGTVTGLWVNGGSNVVVEQLAFDCNFTGVAKDGGQVLASTLLGSSALAAAITTTPSAGTTETWTVNSVAATATSSYAGIPFVFKVDSEFLVCTGGQGTTSWTVRRGFESTTPATHSNGAPITNTNGTLFDTVISKYGINSPKSYMSSQYAGGIDASTYLKQRMAIRITGAANVTVRNCYVHDAVSAGILADAASVNGCTDILITHCRIKSTWDNGVYFHQGVQYATATGNEISDTTYNGVSAVYSDRILVTGNNIRQAGPSFSDSGGVQINGSSNCSVTGNLIDTGQFYGINLLATQETAITGGAGGNQVWASNTVVANNTITNCNAADYPTHTSSGINLFGAANSNLTGNTISGCDYGISLGSKATSTAITSNRITGCKSLGVNVGNSADVTGTFLKTNHIGGCGSHGVYVNAPVRAENNTVVGNNGMGFNLSQPPAGMPNKTDWLLGNTVLDNTDSGVYANAGAGSVAVLERNVFGNSVGVQFNDASVTYNSTTVTSATANFTSADVGLVFVLMDQGSFGVTTATTVQSVTNSTTAVLAAPAQATESGVAFWIGRGPAVYTDGSTTNAANSVLTSATAAFAASDVGKLIVLLSQGPTPAILFAGSVQSVTNATTAVLSGAAGTINACTLIINRSGGQQIRAINNGSGTVIDRGNTVWGIPEILTGGNTYTLQQTDRTVVADTSITLDRTARNVFVTALTAPRTITLADAGTVTGAPVVIADESGAAGTNNITIATQFGQTINGASTYVIRAGYGSVRLVSNGVGYDAVQTLINAAAGTIAALGTQAAGATGLAADAGHVHPTTGLAPLHPYASSSSGYVSGVPYMTIPVGALTVAQAAITAVLGGSGTFRVAAVGDSITAGQNASNLQDGLVYGYLGRLAAALASALGAYAEHYTIAGYGPGLVGSGASSPYNWTATASKFDGGIGQVWTPGDTGAWDCTITIPNHPTTGAAPTAVDLLTVGYNGNLTWQYQVGAASAVTVNSSGQAGGSFTAAVLQRTSITVSGATTIKIGQQSASNALMFSGHVVYYGTTGVGIGRGGIQGWKSTDFATGAGSTAGSYSQSGQGGSLMPDHIQPWDGQTTSNNTAGSGMPFTPHLAIIALGVNDSTYGGSQGGYTKALTRLIHAFRRGRANCSIIIMNLGYPSYYSDNSASGGAPFEYQKFKIVAAGLAAAYGCAYLDIDSLFGETPVASGYQISGDIHPTANGDGAGGGDGHLLIANTILAPLTI